jgi:hypothetical protein
MGVIEQVTVSWKDASFAIVAILACLSASLVSCAHVSVNSVSQADVEITAAIPSPGQIMVSIEDDGREFQEDGLEPCGLPGLRLPSPPSLALSQITPPQSVSLSVLTTAQRPLRC